MAAPKSTFRLWQDKEAIAPGKLWESEIKNAVEQSVFFIPLVTPRMVNSQYCQFEFDSFLRREHALGRNDLVFPILYLPVAALANETKWRNHPVLSPIATRQYIGWQNFRYVDVPTPAMREEIARFCRKIVEALDQPWIAPEERRRKEEADAEARAEAEHRKQEAETKWRAEAEARRNRTRPRRFASPKSAFQPAPISLARPYIPQYPKPQSWRFSVVALFNLPKQMSPDVSLVYGDVDLCPTRCGFGR